MEWEGPVEGARRSDFILLCCYVLDYISIFYIVLLSLYAIDVMIYSASFFDIFLPIVLVKACFHGFQLSESMISDLMLAHRKLVEDAACVSV